MKKAFPLRIIILIVIIVMAAISLSVEGEVKAALNVSSVPAIHLLAPQSNTLTQISPAVCPGSGCAAGQRINFQAVFNDSPQYTAGPNTQVCVYVPASGGAGTTPWANPTSFSIGNTGASGATYTSGQSASVCSNNLPLNFAFLGGAYATLPTSATGDTLNFAFRINPAATVSADLSTPLTVKIFQANSGGSSWTGTALPPKVIPVAAVSAAAFVANDATACGANSPCFMNSGDDLLNGIGTGLKDAVDALPSGATINILGNYSIKSNSVNISQAVMIKGFTNASSLTSGDRICTNAMLLVSAGATITNLSISDGPCTNAGRDLISINSPSNVTVASNTLTNGKNAISIADGSGSVLVQFNQIQGNSGYGILRAAGSGTGTVIAVANNIFGNYGATQANCNNKGQADHNYWGKSQTVATSVAGCTASDGKRLGAPILTSPGIPGVDAGRLTVTGTKTGIASTINSGASLGLSVSTSGPNFDIYFVNHGYGSNDMIPFYGAGTDYLVACGNFFDIFTAEDNTSSPTDLALAFKYDLNPTCISSVESADPASLPLLWFDPLNNSTNGWASINGALLDKTTKEITITLTGSSTPNLTNINFTPFVVGLPNVVKVLSFKVSASIGQALVQWETAYENKLSGYYVVRSLQPNGTYSRTSGLIPSKGNSTIGGNYYFQDTFLDYGTTYYYKLEYVDLNGITIGYYGPVAGITATATPTITPTFTVTPTPTITPTFTRTITPTPSRTWTPYVYYTNTPYQYYTYTPYRIPTWTYTPYLSSTPFITATSLFHLTPLGNLSETPNGTISPLTPVGTNATPAAYGTGGYPQPQTSGTFSANTTAQLTLGPNSSQGVPNKSGTQDKTVNPTSTSSSSKSNTSLLVSLVSGGLLGILVIGFAGWYFFQQKLPK